jgi:deoxyribonuclease V
LACVDVDYREDSAVAECLVFAGWGDDKPSSKHAVTIDKVAPYEPGLFYQRELPCLLKVLREVMAPLGTIVVDGYVWLGADRPGLGAYLYEALERRSAIVGERTLGDANNAVAVPVLRGTSRRPLFVTAAGIDASVAAQHVRSMHGPHRIPTLLGLVDRLARGS